MFKLGRLLNFKRLRNSNELTRDEITITTTAGTSITKNNNNTTTTTTTTNKEFAKL